MSHHRPTDLFAPTDTKMADAKDHKAAKDKERRSTRSQARQGARELAAAARPPSRWRSRQREISVSEFFTKNRHLLGFDSPRKALLTAVKEASTTASTRARRRASCPTSRSRSRASARARSSSR
jgi:hypothetical protein